MPVYFGHPIPTLSKGKKPEASSELKAKGIELLRCAPCDMNIIGIPTAPLAMWGIYKEYFSVILLAIMKGSAVSIFPGDLELSTVHRRPLPLALPPICVSLKNDEQNAIEFLGKHGFEQTNIRGSTFFLCNTVTRTLIKELISPECPAKLEENSFCPFRYVNLNALYSALDLINLFSYAIQAMEFSTTFDSNIDRSDFDREGPEDDEDTLMETEGEEIGPIIPSNLKMVHPIARLFDTEAHPKFPLARIPGTTVNPASLLKRKTFSSVSDFTAEHSGIVLRFVQELANEDKTTVLSFIQSYLFWNLGTTMNDCLATLNQLRSSWGNLQSTDFGLCLTHLAKSLLIAMDTQVSIMPLFDMGFYEGCILQGESFTLSVNNILMRPIGHGKLNEEVISLATHRNTLERILAVIFREVKIQLNVDDYSSMRLLRDTLLGIPLTESTKDEITALAKNLRFPSRPWNVNHTSLMRMIDIIRGLPVISDTTPIGPRGLFTKDMIVVALSCFSEGTCPSLIHANGTPINLDGNLPRPSTGSNKDKSQPRGRQTTSNAAWTFAIRRVRFDEALGDLRNMLREKQARSVSSSVARGLGCVVITGKQFGELFAGLSDLTKILSGSSALAKSVEDTSTAGNVDNDDIIRSDSGRVKRVRV